MKHRERVEIALNRQAPDRCPMYISFTPEFAERLKTDLAITGKMGHNPHGGGNTYQLETTLSVDMLLTSVGWANSYYAAEGDYVDEWGVTWRSVPYDTPYGRGRYTETVQRPLADAANLSSYRPPDPQRPEIYRDAMWTLDNFKDEYWICGVTVCTIFETAWALRGYEQMLVDFATNPDLADTILDIPFKYHLTAAKKLVELGVDMIWIGDDIGAQKRMIMSPATWRRFLKPRMAEFIATIKSLNPNLKVAYHTDGYAIPVIPELIEIGLDVLNPIQPASMDPLELKAKFGDRLSFWGSIDEQYTLPFGTPSQVRDEVLLRLNTIGKGGGLILGPTHNVQLDTPMENFWAMVETVLNTPYAEIEGEGLSKSRV